MGISGSYSFIDPKHEVRTVEYVADKNGFHPHLTNYEDTQAFPVDSEAVRLAKAKHFALYQKIASANAAGPARSVPRVTHNYYYLLLQLHSIAIQFFFSYDLFIF